MVGIGYCEVDGCRNRTNRDTCSEHDYWDMHPEEGDDGDGTFISVLYKLLVRR